ncbi:DUF4116 domain-containing protein [Clostridioides sp. ZZV14-6045]|uniref:DUF4116 domain-containing protein n=1 Tax=Clostridioides sp. ZZV14-6045 TaxID=2811489 RepID=UPI001D110FCD|nr:DUF4116 domain-containing protein [Clostridioides sp. ZZV14-6045]
MKRERIDLYWIRKYPWALKYAEKQTYDMCLEAVTQNGLLLEDVRWDELNLTKEQIYNLYIIAVRQDGLALRYIKNQTEEICMEAVKQDGRALKYVKNQTEEICIEAVKEDGLTLIEVKEQTDKICKEALKEDKHEVRYVNDKEKYLEEFGIRYLEAQGKVREVIAIKKNREWLFTLGCQINITKEEFLYRIYNTAGGFDLKLGINVHRKVYIDFLEQFE